MKAWKVKDEKSYEGGCTVVFAETRGKAHVLAMNTDLCEGADWNDVWVTRLPKMDDHDRGRKEINWYDEEDRITLVKECGWYCDETNELEDCEICPAAEWCDRGKGIEEHNERAGKEKS